MSDENTRTAVSSTSAPPRRGAVWGHSTHPRAEMFEGAYATREEAIADGRAIYGEGFAFYVMAGHWIDPLEFFCASRIVDAATELLYDNAPDEADFEMPRESLGELDAFLRDWCARISIDKWQGVGEPALVPGLGEQE